MSDFMNECPEKLSTSTKKTGLNMKKEILSHFNKKKTVVLKLKVTFQWMTSFYYKFDQSFLGVL